MSLKEQAFRVAVLGALKDALANAYTQDRAELLEALLAAREQLGVKSLDVSLQDGTKVATVTLTEPSARVDVVDELAFTKWVQANYPDEVQTVTLVRPAFRKALLEELVDDSGGDAVNPRTGELVTGVMAKPPGRPRQFSLRYTPEGRPAIGRAWAAGELHGYAGPPLELDDGGT